METEKNVSKEIPWTWADQISSYKFWGITLFFIFLIIPNIIINFSYTIFKENLNLSISEIGTALTIKSIASLGGFWLAWLVVRGKNLFLLYIYAAFTILGLLLLYFTPSFITLCIAFFLIGLSFGAISLAIPAIISGGRGGSEMFVVSFGLITFYQAFTWNSFSGLLGWLFVEVNGYDKFVLIALGCVLLGTLLLIPVKANLFTGNPPKREFSLTPQFRDPSAVALLCLIPIFNIYYMIHLSYRYHGEINALNPSQNILSPRAGAWCYVLLPMFAPMITSSLNSSLTSKLSEEGNSHYYKNWAVILWSFLLIPVSFALIQSNMNKLINHEVSDKTSDSI
jgi:hypothetical protein